MPKPNRDSHIEWRIGRSHLQIDCMNYERTQKPLENHMSFTWRYFVQILQIQ